MTPTPELIEKVARAILAKVRANSVSLADLHEEQEYWCSLAHVAILAIPDLEPSGEWRPIETAPKAADSNEPVIPILLSWTYLAEDRSVSSRGVGEGYWVPEHGGADGDWWWANTMPADYVHDTIINSISGQVTHWMPLPPPPRDPQVEGDRT